MKNVFLFFFFKLHKFYWPVIILINAMWPKIGTLIYMYLLVNTNILNI